MPDGEGGVDIYVATQWLHVDRDQVAPCLGLAPEQVRIHLAGVGGAFGGREDLSMQVHGALLALHTGRPVKIVYNREESFVGHIHRHPARMWCEHRATRDGRLVNVRMRILLDGGAYASSSTAVASNAASFAVGPYRVDNALIEATAVYTNNPPCGAMRGFGAVQTCFAAEAQMDLLAAELEIDPIELRLLNALGPGDVLPTGQVIDGLVPRRRDDPRRRRDPDPAGRSACRATRSGCPAVPATRRAARASVAGSASRSGSRTSATRKASTTPAPPASCCIADGSADVHCAAAEVGQGVVGVILQVARTELGTDAVRLMPHTTATVGSAGSTSASRMTWMAAGAVRDACRAALEERERSGAQRGRRRAGVTGIHGRRRSIPRRGRSPVSGPTSPWPALPCVSSPRSTSSSA